MFNFFHYCCFFKEFFYFHCILLLLYKEENIRFFKRYIKSNKMQKHHVVPQGTCRWRPIFIILPIPYHNPPTVIDRNTKDQPLVSWRPPSGCIFSTPPRTPLRTAPPPACASWWCLCAPFPTCRGWVTHRTLWACCIWVQDSAKWWPGRRPQWSGGGPARPGWQNGSRMSRTPEDVNAGVDIITQ